MATLEQIAAERESREAADAPEPRGALETVEDVFRSIASGATSGGAEELSAFMAAQTGIGGMPDAEPGYEGELAAQRARDEEIPTLTRVGGEIAGAFLNPLTRRNIPAKIPGWLNAVGLGGLFGAGYGFGTGEGGFENRAEQAGELAALGAGTGGVLYPAAQGVGWAVRKGWEALKRAMSPEGAATSQLATNVARDQMTPQRVESRLRNLGPQAMIADAGGQNVRSLARAAAGRPGVAANRASIALNQRARGEAGRIRKRTPPSAFADDVYAAREAFLEDMQRRASPLYEKAYAEYTALMTPTLQRIISGKSGQRALREAADIVDNLVSANRLPAQVAADVRAAAEGGKTISLRTWNHIKIGLDALLDNSANRNPVTGKLKGQGFSINVMRQELLKELDRVTGGMRGAYARARKIWAGDSEAIEALQLGRKILRKDPEEITGELRRMSEAGQEAYRTGAARAIMDVAERTGDTASAATRLFGNARNRARFRAIFPDQKSFHVFQRILTQEQRFAQTRNFVTGGSMTAPRQAGAADLSSAGSVGAMIGSNMPFLPGVGARAGARFAERAKSAIFGDGTPMDEALSRMLFSRDPSTNAQTISSIRNAAKSQNLTDDQVGILARGTLLAITEQEGRALAR